MQKFLEKVLEKCKFAYLWISHILFAKSHFKVNFFTRLRMNFHGFTADQYVLYNLRGDRYKQYLSEYDWYHSRTINHAKYSGVLNNKIIASELIGRYADVAKIYATRLLSNGDIFIYGQDKWASVEEVVALIKTKGSVIIKPLAVGKGNGVHRFAFEDGAWTIDRKPAIEADITNYLTKHRDWFISEEMKQGTFSASLYSETTNTIRLITYRVPETGEHDVMFAVQRIGTKATIPVDNGSMGALVACINLETGELSEATSLHCKDRYKVHPDSGSKIKGAVVPNWDNVKDQALNLARKFPEYHFIAWDILLTPKGMCIIEANTSSGVNIIQLWGPQRFGKLGDFYRYHGVIK